MPAAAAGRPAAGKTTVVRELLVPMDDLNVLLENQPRRVLLSRQEYEALLEKARARGQARPPRPAVLADSQYTTAVTDGRARIEGTLTIEVLSEGIQAVPLGLAYVGLQSATLDGKPAALGQDKHGRLMLFVEGRGQHELRLSMTAPVQTTAATQVLTFRLPTAPSARFDLSVEGDVEVKCGLNVVDRRFDTSAEVTRFKLLPRGGNVSLVMTLNSRLRRKDRIVLARSVLLAAVTESGQRVYSNVTLTVLHRGAERFRFAVPENFEITAVHCPDLSSWAVAGEDDRRVLEVRLRQATTGKVVLSVSAERNTPQLDDWNMPRLRPLDTDGEATVVGLLLQDRLKPKTIIAKGLIPIDVSVLRPALPESMRRGAMDEPPLVAVAAYYAPGGDYAVQARFEKPPARLSATTVLLLKLSDREHRLRGDLLLAPEQEPLFELDFGLANAWHVERVVDAHNKPIPFERHKNPARVHVRLPRGIVPGTQATIRFEATRTPPEWLGDWKERKVDFPEFQVLGNVRQRGAIAVAVADDLSVRPETETGLTALDESEKKEFSLGGVKTALAYRHADGRYRATFKAQRTPPRLTARTYSFLRVTPGMLVGHYEIVYDVAAARTRKLQFRLPKTTPTDLAIRGLGGVRLKQYVPESTDQGRQWTVQLAEARRGRIALAVDFQQPLGDADPRDLALPVVAAEGVAHQSGLVAVEGNAELDVQLATEARQVDVGELAGAEYRPGRRLLGVYSFVGEPAPVKINAYRHPAYRLSTTIVQAARLTTRLSAQRVAQTDARFRLRTKALYLEVELPTDSELWSAWLDGKPIKPQRQSDRLLLNLAGETGGKPRELQLVYETRVAPVGLLGELQLNAPRLLLRASEDAAGVEVPLAALQWELVLPWRYRVVRSDGTLMTNAVRPTEPAVFQVARWLGATPTLTAGRQAAREAKEAYPSASLADSSAPEHRLVTIDREIAEQKKKLAEIRVRFKATGKARAIEARFNTLMKARAQHAQTRKPGSQEALSRLQKDIKELTDELGTADGATLSENMKRTLGEYTNARKRLADLEEAKRTLTRSEGDILAFGERLYVDKSEEGVALKDSRIAAGYEMHGRRIAGPSSVKAKGKSKYSYSDGLDLGLQGMRSLKINLTDRQTGQQLPSVVFQSLGEDPRLDLTLADAHRFRMLGWGLAMATVLVGLAIGRHPARAKVRFLIAVGLVASLLPMAPGCEVLAEPCNMVFYAALLLVPYYLLVAGLRRLLGFVGCVPTPKRAAVSAGAVLLVLAASVQGVAAGPPKSDGPVKVELVDPLPVIRIPKDAILIPYDPDSPAGIENADRCFVPYEQYVDLWNRANPDKAAKGRPAPCDYALAGASYRARLADGDDLLLEGELEIVVHKASGTAVPLRLGGGVLAEAKLDGKPARLSVAQPKRPSRRAQSSQKPNALDSPEAAVLLLHVPQSGRHKLTVAVRLRLHRHGGWHLVGGVVPAAPASSLVLTVPEAGTDVRLSETADRQSFETRTADQEIQTVLGRGGIVRLQWRPKLARTEVQHSLTARTEAVFDVQEDATRVAWDLALEFRRDQRQQFTVGVPGDYLVENVEGPNVRGWNVTRSEKTQRVEVTLLKPAKDTERFSLRLRRAGVPAELTVPNVTVEGAAIESGRLSIRRSPLLEMQTLWTRGVGRTDFAPPKKKGRASTTLENPLGLRPYQAYRFVSVPFSMVLKVSPIRARAAAEVQSILTISDHQRHWESVINLDVRHQRIYQAALLLPADFELEEVRGPGEFQWAITKDEGKTRGRLTVYFAAGQHGCVPIQLRGKLGAGKTKDRVRLPRLRVLGVDRQQGDIAVEADPSLRVRPEGLKHCHPVLRDRLHGWLKPQQRQLTQLALRYEGPDYEGHVVLSRRRPRVKCMTISNVRVTRRALEETILLNFTISEADIRRVRFTLPYWMRECRISVPWLRQKTIEPIGNEPDARLRVTLDLHEVTGQLRVLVQNDRLLSAELHTAPIPVVLTGVTTQRFVAIESAGRDEVVVDRSRTTGLERLNPNGSEWKTLQKFLKQGITLGYVVTEGAGQPELAFATRQRKAVVTAGAKIDLAETHLLVDASGAYRGRVVYHMDNTTEQFLPIELPHGGRLWSACVAGEPVKPIRVNPADDRFVRVPLVKTAAGELDYEVTLLYGGKLSSIGSLGGAVGFPLLRTNDPSNQINLNPEVSQVRLHLPRTHRWFDFGGTMRLVETKSQLLAGKVASQAKQATRLSETMRSGNEYARARAARNVSDLQSKMNATLQHFTCNLGSDAQFKKDVADSTRAVEQVQQQARRQQAEQASQQAGQAFNRDRLNDLYATQQVKRARGAVVQYGSNFQIDLGKKQTARKTAEDAKQPRFDKQWLDQNELAQRQIAPTAQVGLQMRLPASSTSGLVPQRLATAQSDARVMRGGAGGMGGMGGMGMGGGKPGGMGSSEKKLYMHQVKPSKPRGEKPMESEAWFGYSGQTTAVLSRTIADNEAVAYPSSAEWAMTVHRNAAAGVLIGGRGLPKESSVRRGHSAAPSGLASLPGELPTPDQQYYQTYLFTTPRGKVEITARAASTDLLRSGRNTSILIVGFVLLVLLARTRPVRWFATLPGGFALIVLGALLTISCIVPLLGILLLGAGVIIVATRWRSRAGKGAAVTTG